MVLASQDVWFLVSSSIQQLCRFPFLGLKLLLWAPFLPNQPEKSMENRPKEFHFEPLCFHGSVSHGSVGREIIANIGSTVRSILYHRTSP